MEIQEEFSTRLNKALEYRNMKPVDLAKRTGLSESTISQYRSGYSKPKEKKLALIATALNINPAWLMGLDVPITNVNSYSFGFEDGTRNIIELKNNDKVSDAISLYEKYVSADPHIRNAVDALLKDIPPASEPLDKH